ncbi:inorganic phosphate transporter [Halococcus agarilyticus]|uniref:inorganic phosphate transporter n=1 Tax=Halococcus agarilyticus TaxID=1232219 RepID=UPI0006777BD7|nr:inorganic phosphate transporter [Halococcus agarilyticus]
MANQLLLVGIALVAALFMSWTIGANSNSPPLAPAVGADSLPVMRAALLVGLFASLGAVVQGGSISETVGRNLIHGTRITPLAAAALLTAATFISLGVFRGYPIPSAFTVTGSVVGVGLALGGSLATAEYAKILGFWAAIVVVEGVLGFVIATVLRYERVPESASIPFVAGFVGFAIANIRLSVIPTGGAGEQGTLARYLAATAGLTTPVSLGSYTLTMGGVSLLFGVVAFVLVRRSLRRSLESGMQRFLIVLGLLVTFTSGGTQVGLATGPLETVFSGNLGFPTVYLLLLGGAGILVGAWTGAPRLVQAVSTEYATLGPRRSIAALVPAFLMAQLAIVFGIPISFNKVMISSIIGAGLAARPGSGDFSPRKTGYTVVSWVGSMLGAGAVSFALYRVLSTIPGLS